MADTEGAAGDVVSASAQLTDEYPEMGNQAAAGEAVAAALTEHPDIGGAIVITVSDDMDTVLVAVANMDRTNAGRLVGIIAAQFLCDDDPSVPRVWTPNRAERRRGERGG